MLKLFLLTSLFLTFAFACGGGESEDNAGAAQSTTVSGDDRPPASPESDDDGDGSPSGSGGAGTASVTVGDETFRFEIECQFGTGIIRGPGTSGDGTPAWLDASMPVDARGSPANDPTQVGVMVRVGIAELFGQPVYDYTVNDTLGMVSAYADDGTDTSGEAQFSYGDGSGSKEGFTHGDLLAGSWSATCP
jgi:hypothetical protein